MQPPVTEPNFKSEPQNEIPKKSQISKNKKIINQTLKSLILFCEYVYVEHSPLYHQSEQLHIHKKNCKIIHNSKNDCFR